MPKISLSSANITKYVGDAIACPCDADLTGKNNNFITKAIFETSGPDLQTELAIIGSGDLGHAVITRGYKLKVKHLIFFPFKDSRDPEKEFNYLLLHQSIKSIFGLASLYKIKTLAISLPHIKIRRSNFMDKIINRFLKDESENHATTEEIIDIISAVCEENKTVLEEVTIYR